MIMAAEQAKVKPREKHPYHRHLPPPYRADADDIGLFFRALDKMGRDLEFPERVLAMKLGPEGIRAAIASRIEAAESRGFQIARLRQLGGYEIEDYSRLPGFGSERFDIECEV